MDAGMAERESEFGVVKIWKNRMIEVGGWQDGTFSQPKVRRKVGCGEIINDRIAGRVLSILVDPRIQARGVVIVDFFVIDGLIEQTDSVGLSPVKGIVWFQGCLDIEVGDERGHFRIVFLEVVPLTLPDVDEPVPEGQ